MALRMAEAVPEHPRGPTGLACRPEDRACDGTPARLGREERDVRYGSAPAGASELEIALVSHFAACGMSAPMLSIAGPLAASSFSRVFRGEGNVFPEPVAIKQFLRDQFGGTPIEAARRYFAALQELSECGSQIGLGVSRPFLMLEASNLVVASWIDGPALSGWLRGAAPANRCAMLREAGIWLARLHRVTQVDSRPPDLSERLEQTALELAESGRMGRSRLLRRALAALLASSTTLSKEPVQWARLHGDFKPSNLVVRHGRLFGIDVDLLMTAPVVNDLAHFLNHVEIQFYSIRALLQARQRDDMVAAFLEGYATESCATFPTRLLSWQRLHNAVHLLTEYRVWSRGVISLPVRFILQRLVRSLSHDLVRQAGQEPRR